MVKEWNKGFVGKLIQMYRERPCLWKFAHKQYTNNTVRTKAYEEILIEFREYFPQANLDLLKAKIQNMRCSYRKELKKLERSRRKGIIYKPKLWYFDLLHFTRNQDRPPPRPNANNEIEDYTIIEDRELSEDDTFLNETSGDEINSRVKYDDLVFKEKRPIKKPHATTSDKDLSNIILTCGETSSSANDDCSVFGTYVSQKLRKMDAHQQILAEALIQKILTKGLKQQLCDEIEVIERIDEIDEAASDSQSVIVSEFYEYTSNGLSRIKDEF